MLECWVFLKKFCDLHPTPVTEFYLELEQHDLNSQCSIPAVTQAR